MQVLFCLVVSASPGDFGVTTERNPFDSLFLVLATRRIGMASICLNARVSSSTGREPPLTFLPVRLGIALSGYCWCMVCPVPSTIEIPHLFRTRR